MKYRHFTHSLLRQIQEQGAPPFSLDDEKHFRSSLDANELGIAFDLLCWKFAETGRPIPQQVYDLIAEAGSRIDGSPGDWQKLKSLVR